MAFVTDNHDPSGLGMFSKVGRFTSEKYIIFQKKDEILFNKRKFLKVSTLPNLDLVFFFTFFFIRIYINKSNLRQKKIKMIQNLTKKKNYQRFYLILRKKIRNKKLQKLKNLKKDIEERRHNHFLRCYLAIKSRRDW